MPWTLSPGTTPGVVRTPADSSSLMAQTNANRSWSPPASGCSRARSSRHICRSSDGASHSTLLASNTGQDLLSIEHSTPGAETLDTSLSDNRNTESSEEALRPHVASCSTPHGVPFQLV